MTAKTHQSDSANGFGPPYSCPYGPTRLTSGDRYIHVLAQHLISKHFHQQSTTSHDNLNYSIFNVKQIRSSEFVFEFTFTKKCHSAAQSVPCVALLLAYGGSCNW